MTPEHQVEVDAAIAAAKEELRQEFLKTRTSLEAWVMAHPLIAFRLGVVGGVLGGGFTVYGVFRVFL